MAKHIPLRHRSWRPQQLFGDRARQRRNLLRAIATVGFVSLLAVFLFVVLRPLDHIRTRVAFLTAAPYQSVGVRGVPYAGESWTALQALRPALLRSPTELPRLNNSESLRDIAAALESSPTDALILFAAADGLLINGEPHLLGAGYEPTRPRAGAVPMRSFLAELKAQQAAVKLLILDTGYEPYDPRNGRLVDDFVHYLDAEVTRNDDASLWVLVSHASHQPSHVSPALRRTVFSFFVTEGLRGAADANLDQQITVAELHRFARRHVDAWVKQATAGRESQTVRLLSSEGEAAEAPLLSVSNFELEQRLVEVKAAFATANRHRESFPMVAVAEAPSKSLREQLPALPRSAEDYQSRRRQWNRFLAAVSESRLNTSANASESTPEETAPAEDEASPADGAEAGEQESDQPSEASEKTAEAADGTFPQRTLDLYQERAEVIQELMTLRDQVRHDIHHYRRVLARAPHLWREFETRLQAAWLSLSEQRVEATDQRFEQLRQLRPTLRALAARRAVLPSTRRGLPMRFANAWNHTEIDNVLADAGIVQDVFSSPLEPLLDESTEPDVQAFLKAMPAMDRSPEIRLLRQLAAHPDIPWADQRLVLQAEQLARQTSLAAAIAVPWVREQIDIADVYRHDALRDLLSDFQADELPAVRTKVEAACEHYLLAAETIQTIYIAQLVRDLCLYELPPLLTWASQSLNSPPNQSIDIQQVGQLLTHAKELSRLLERSDPQRLPEVKLELGLAIGQLRAVREAFSPASIDQLVNTRLAADRSGIDALVHSTLLAGAAATALAKNQLVLDAELADSYQPPHAAALAAAPIPASGMANAATQRRWESYEELAQVELDLVGFVAQTSPAENRLKAAVQGRGDEETRWRAAQQVEQRVQQSLAGLPDVIDGLLAEANPERFAEIHAAHRAMLALDPRDASRLLTTQSSQPRYAAEAYRFLNWRREALRKAQAFADATQRQRLEAQAAQLTRAATNLYAEAPLPSDDRPRIEIECQAELVNGEERGAIRVTLRNREQTPLHCWVIADANEPSLTLGAAEAPVYTLQEPQERLRPETAPSLQLAAGASRELLLPFELVGQAQGPITVRVRTVASSRAELTPLADAGMLARQVVPVLANNAYDNRVVQLRTPQSPQVAFRVTGPKNCVEPRMDGYRLLTFPNRETAFQFSLANQSSQAQQLTVRLLRSSQAPERLPRGAVNRRQADAILAALGDLTPIGGPLQIKLESKATAPLPLPESGDDAPQPALSNALIAIVEAEGSDEVVVRCFETQVQHPRRYVVPTARYSSQRQRVELDLRVKTDAGLPSGAIPLRAHVEPPLTAGVSSRLDGALESEQAASLHIDIPRNPGSVATVHLDVDGYPRAFTFRVRCNADSEGELAEPLSVSFQSPNKFQSFLAPSPSIPVELQVNAPRGAMKSSQNYIEVGIDEDMDRDFQGDRTIKLQSERQLSATLASTSADGRFVIATVARDHQLDVPANGLRNVRVNLLAHLRLGRVVAQDSVEDLWLDGLPPRVVVQEVAPGRIVEAGSPVTLTMNVVDETRGFAKSVQAAFDKTGKGTFDPEEPPVEGAKQKGIAWQVEVPTEGLKPGRHSLLVRAIDHVGNVSDYTTLSLTIVPPLPNDGLGKIGGIVTYRGAPAAGANLELTPEDATVQLKVNEAQSGEQGAFTFDQLPPGKYRVVARLLRRNARLKLEQDVEVEAPPKKPKFLQFDFK